MTTKHASLNVRVTDATRRRIDRVAGRAGVTAAQWIRRLVERELAKAEKDWLS